MNKQTNESLGALTIAMELNIGYQMKYLDRMLEVQAISRTEYIEEMSNLAIVLETLSKDVFGYQEGGEN